MTEETHCQVCGSRIFDLEYDRLARAVLLFHRGGPWTEADQQLWFMLTDTMDVTTKSLCDLARKAVKP